jgi:hypothetical protein
VELAVALVMSGLVHIPRSVDGEKEGDVMAKHGTGSKATGDSKHGTPGVRWLDDVAEHDFAAAKAYLSLCLDPAQVDELVKDLRAAKVTTRRANDVLRACRRAPLPLDDPGVKRDLLKAVSGEKLSPILVVTLRDGADIADGYHRASLAYHLDPFGDVPLRIGSELRKK